MVQNRLLILGARTNQIPIIRTAKEMGLRVLVMDPDCRAPGFEFADERLCIDLSETKKCIGYARAKGIAGVLTGAADFPMRTVAAITANLNLEGPSQTAIENVTNKNRLREILKNAGLPGPKFGCAHDEETLVRVAGEFSGAVLIKPTVGQGGRGVTKVDEVQDQDALMTAFGRAKMYDRGAGVQIEEFIEGPEVSVETLTFNGTTKVIGITEKLTSGPPYFVEIGHNFPASLSKQVRRKVIEVSCAAMKCMKLDYCAGHIEMKLTSAGPVLIEIGPRLGGGFITSHLVPLSTGIDLIKATINLALGIEATIFEKFQKGAAIRFFTPTPGTFDSVKGLQKARRIPGVEEVQFDLKKGEQVALLTDTGSRIGHILSGGKTAVEAQLVAEQAIAEVQIVTIPDCDIGRS